VQTVPDMEAKEETVTLEKASDVQTLDGWVEVLGASAMNSGSISKSLSVGAVGLGSVGYTDSSAKSAGEATGVDKKSNQVSSKNVKELIKTRYFFEPKLQIDVTNTMLTKASDFSARTKQISYDLCQMRGQGGCGKKWKPEYSTATATATPVVVGEVKPAVIGTVEVRFVVENMLCGMLQAQSALAVEVENTVVKMILAQLPDTKDHPKVKVTLSKPGAPIANPLQDTMIVATLNASTSIVQLLQDKKHPLSLALEANFKNVLNIVNAQRKDPTSKEPIAFKVKLLEVIQQQVALLDYDNSTATPAVDVSSEVKSEVIGTLDIRFEVKYLLHKKLAGVAEDVKKSVKYGIVEYLKSVGVVGKGWDIFGPDQQQLREGEQAPEIEITLSGIEGELGKFWLDTLVVATLNVSTSVIQLLQDKVAPLSQSIETNLKQGLGYTGGIAQFKGNYNRTEKERLKGIIKQGYFEYEVLRLEMTSVQQALARIAQLEVGEAIKNLIFDFGTHVCPHVVLGGWWSVRATSKSIENRRFIDVDKATTEAIKDAASDSMGVTASGQAKGITVSGSYAKSSANADEKSKTQGERDTTQAADKDSSMEVEQKWKGGASGTSPELWRKSLDSSLSSNWKTIDRKLEMCEGIWSFVEDDEDLKRRLCENWIGMYLESQGVLASKIDPTVEQQACANTMGMRALIKSAEDMKAREKKEFEEKEKSRCNKQNHTFWDDSDKICSVRQCYCTVLTSSEPVKGTSGAECPKNFEKDCDGCCKKDQLDFCKNFVKGCKEANIYMVVNPAHQGERCKTGVCSTKDVEHCCHDFRKAADFWLGVTMKTASEGNLFSGYNNLKGSPRDHLNARHSHFKANEQQKFHIKGPYDKKLCLSWKTHMGGIATSSAFDIKVVKIYDKEGKVVLAEMENWEKLGSSHPEQCRDILWKV
ncbi:unnamed protein product, partial [Polarella glacialis]